ncbi:circadian clock protein KaiB [Flavobacterium sp. D33]|nr:circadian clock protein KaiB [Flavobacterium selenitireducens]
MSVKSLRAIENFNAIYLNYLKDSATLKIIDISMEKEYAVRYGIVAIPTLIRSNPIPVRTIVGDLSDTSKVLEYLGILEK